MHKKLLFGAVLLMIALLALEGCGGTQTAVQSTQEPLPTFDIAEETPDAAATFREATLYYISDEGYVVPVRKLIPWEEGIAKACLGYITSTPDNDAAAAAMGLKTVLPSGTRISLSITNGDALIDLNGLAPLGSKQEEEAMLSAVVDTLTEFATVDTVTVRCEGRGGSLPNGAELPERSPRRSLNVEDTELAVSAGSVPATLYFPNSSGSLTVPVTRYFGASPSLYASAAALIEGPRGRGLMCCFPQGTLLLGAAMENSVATINLSEDFRAVADTEGMYTLAYRTLLMTLSERFDIERLVIQVNGSVYAPEAITDL